jgi:hypothetical protein
MCAKVSPVLLVKDPEQPRAGTIRRRAKRVAPKVVVTPSFTCLRRLSVNKTMFKLRTPESIRKRRQSMQAPKITAFQI